MARKKRTSLQKSYYKSASLLVIIIFIMIFSSKLGTLVQLADEIFNDDKLTESSYDANKRFDEKNQIRIKKENRGLWKFDTRGDNNYSYLDRIELKDNGIIWRYEEYTLPFPYGETITMRRGSTAYLLPYAPSESDSTFIVSNLRTIRESWMSDSDTCQGNSFYDNLWSTSLKDSNTFIINGKTYTRYTGKVPLFFPNGTVETIDNPLIDGCSALEPFLDFKRKNIIKRVKNNRFVSGEIRHEQFELLRSYYYPYCIKGIDVNLEGAKGSEILLFFTINLKGTPENIKITGKAVASTSVKDRFKSEISKWYFPSISNSDTLQFKAIW